MRLFSLAICSCMTPEATECSICVEECRDCIKACCGHHALDPCILLDIHPHQVIIHTPLTRLVYNPLPQLKSSCYMRRNPRSAPTCSPCMP